MKKFSKEGSTSVLFPLLGGKWRCMWEENSFFLKVIWTKPLLNATRDNKKEEDGDKIHRDTDRGHVCSLVKQPDNLLHIFATI